MKKIWLKDEQGEWDLYSYENISELKKHLERNNIDIHDSVEIGNLCTISDYVKIEKNVSIGNLCAICINVKISKNVKIGNYCGIWDDVKIGKNSIISENSIIKTNIPDYTNI